MLGQEVYYKDLRQDKTFHQLKVDVSGFSTGLYTIDVKTNNGVGSKKLSVVN